MSLKHPLICPTVNGTFGCCYLENCLTVMQAYPDKAFDLMFTDTLWGHDYQDNAQKPMGINQKAHKHERVPYLDKWDPDFHLKWFKEAQRISNAQVVCVGRKHKNWWIQTFNPIDWVTIYYKNGQGSTKISKYSAKMDYYCFGDEAWWKEHKFHRDVYETYIHNGFLRDEQIYQYKHPSPKDYKTWAEMLMDLKPSSILDPFMGSGCLAEVGEALGFCWAGCELNQDANGKCAYYDEDIEHRIFLGKARFYKQKKEKTQTTLD
jgi:DNA modification methylase